MPSNLSPVWSAQLLTAQVATTTAAAASAVIRIPQMETYLFILDVTTLTGTATTLDVAIGISPASTLGTPALTTSTWHYIEKFTQVTTGTGSWQLRMQPTMGRGEAATAGVAGGSATVAITAGTAVALNSPLTPDIRFSWVPNCQTNYVFSIYAYGYAKADSSY